MFPYVVATGGSTSTFSRSGLFATASAAYIFCSGKSINASFADFVLFTKDGIP